MCDGNLPHTAVMSWSCEHKDCLKGDSDEMVQAALLLSSHSPFRSSCPLRLFSHTASHCHGHISLLRSPSRPRASHPKPQSSPTGLFTAQASQNLRTLQPSTVFYSNTSQSQSQSVWFDFILFFLSPKQRVNGPQAGF